MVTVVTEGGSKEVMYVWSGCQPTQLQWFQACRCVIYCETIALIGKLSSTHLVLSGQNPLAHSPVYPPATLHNRPLRTQPFVFRPSCTVQDLGRMRCGVIS